MTATVFAFFLHLAECVGGEVNLGNHERVFVAFNSPDQQEEPLRKEFFHPQNLVVWRNAALDATVLELVPSHDPLPPPLGNLHGDASGSDTLCLIGYDDSATNNRVLDLLCPVKKFSDLSPEFLQENATHVFDMSDQRRTLLLTSLTHGSSGSPGFDEHGRLVVMYTRGYPNENPQVEQAVNIVAVKEQMITDDPQLAEHLFGDVPACPVYSVKGECIVKYTFICNSYQLGYYEKICFNLCSFYECCISSKTLNSSDSTVHHVSQKDPCSVLTIKLC